MGRSTRKSKGKSRRDTTLVGANRPRRVENRMAPPKYAERHHARPGAGIKRSRASMAPKSR